MSEERSPLRYVVLYQSREYEECAAHIWAYTAEDAAYQMSRSLHKALGGRLGDQRFRIEPYREEDHGPWNHPAMDDAGRAHLRIRKMAETGR